MGETLYRLSSRDPNDQSAINAGQEIENAINEILKLDDEDISLICYDAFEQLKKARIITNNNYYESILEALTDDDLIALIHKFKIGLPNIDKELDQINKMLEQLETLDSEVKFNEQQMTAKRIMIGNLPSEEPGGWARFIADTKPGLLKSFFLLFIRKKSIDAAKSKCAEYDSRNALIAEVSLLESTNIRLNEQIEEKNSKNNDQKTLSSHQQILQKNIKLLEENADSLMPKAKHDFETEAKTQNEVQQHDEDDELQFTME
ncbi:hypothetical protein DGG96_11880 [Legionella qingyii]|uniref:Uncharacterized protein n=1 Tax=Legionella qingyii TaxID=2184757 RepID=A0A317U138_9GAMM|nr:hypothetical protein [Legionella qingyii]PWY55471.1 hypothetical protein DGG96_11880 [Legionella qingyii]RUR21325.1 hypothetical protein ELY20_12555 [Legionella qingyii]RUR24549.1 hypothetical protein ELY16_11390 [Legionella qingyii]